MTNPKLNQDTILKIKIAYGVNILQLRKKAGLSQAELAHRCNTDARKIGKTEKGNYDLRPQTIMALANALNADIKDIIPIDLLNDLKSDIWIKKGIVS